MNSNQNLQTEPQVIQVNDNEPIEVQVKRHTGEPLSLLYYDNGKGQNYRLASGSIFRHIKSGKRFQIKRDIIIINNQEFLIDASQGLIINALNNQEVYPFDKMRTSKAFPDMVAVPFLKKTDRVASPETPLDLVNEFFIASYLIPMGA